MTDYDLTDIAAGYDRARDHGPAVLDQWMQIIANHVDDQHIARILDLGCGTGRFSEALAARFNADVVGLDPSVRMLQVARAKLRHPRVRYELGRAEAIPLPNASIDLVFMSMCFHHFADRLAAAHECRRVLADYGTVVIRTGTRDQIPSYPYVRFFPASRELLEATLPTTEDINAAFAEAGLFVAAAPIITQTIAANWSIYADKLSAGGDSILAQLSLSEFDAGLAAVKDYSLTHASTPVVEPINLFTLSTHAPIAAV
jgi:ubiquinone/menaquinone biosynthesis C-methylase UbiE